MKFGSIGSQIYLQVARAVRPINTENGLRQFRCEGAWRLTGGAQIQEEEQHHHPIRLIELVPSEQTELTVTS